MIHIIDTDQTGKHLRDLIFKKGFSVEDVQKKLNLKSPQSVYRWFYGKSFPTVDHLYALAVLLETPIDGLLVIKQKNIEHEHIKDIIRWCSDKTKESNDLRKAYWEALGVIVLSVDKL